MLFCNADNFSTVSLANNLQGFLFYSLCVLFFLRRGDYIFISFLIKTRDLLFINLLVRLFINVFAKYLEQNTMSFYVIYFHGLLLVRQNNRVTYIKLTKFANIQGDTLEEKTSDFFFHYFLSHEKGSCVIVSFCWTSIKYY